MNWYYCYHCDQTISVEYIWTCRHIHTNKKGDLTGACIMCNNCGRYIQWEQQIIADSEEELQKGIDLYKTTGNFPRQYISNR